MDHSPFPFVSVVIPTYNRCELLEHTLRSLFGQTYPGDRFEIIVVDGGSTDRTEEIVKSATALSPCPLRYHRKSMEGPGSSRNAGIALAKGSVVAFTDDDCVAHPDWLRNGIRGFGDGVGLVQGKTLPNPGQTRETFSQTQEILSETGVYETCNMFYRKDVLDRVGGFSPEFIGLYRPGKPRIGGEDTDLAWRAMKAGWKSAFSGDALVYHHVFPVPLRRVVFDERRCRYHFHTLPTIAKRHPEMARKTFYHNIFIEKDRALFLLFLSSIAMGASVHALFFAFAFPYTVHLLAWSFYRRTLRSYPFGFIVALAFLARDTVDTAASVLGSVWHRRLLL